MGTERKPIATAEEWMRNQERRSAQQERRRQIHNASDLLGPGFGPTAKQILDWNSEEATFTGFFWSPVGGINSPDGESEWIGYTISEDDRRYGVQRAISVRENDPALEFTRRFENPSAGLTPTYTPWRGQVDWQLTGGVVIGPCTLTSFQWRKTGSTVAVAGNYTLTDALTVQADGNVVPNTLLVQVPAEIIPNGSILSQGIGGGATGPLQQYYVNSDGQIGIAAVAPGSSLGVGDGRSFSGTYML